MADNNNKSEYKTLELKWILPVDSPQGLVCALKNIVSVLSHVQKNNCNIECINKIIDNDIEPMIMGLSDEYDFIFASVIIVVWDRKKDFSDVNEVILFATKILGEFIVSIEKLFKEIEEKEQSNNDQITGDYTIDTSCLEIGMAIKNYKELCLLLKVQPTTGKAKQLQLEDFGRFFTWEKAGQKFIITDIYLEPLDKEDKRKIGNNSIYVKCIELIIMQYLSKQEGYTRTFTKRNWWELLGMINEKYNKINRNRLRDLDYTVTNFEINSFYQRCNKKLEQILFSALNNLKNRKLIIYEIQTVIVEKEGKEQNYFLANDENKKRILQVERSILKNVMGFEKIIQVYFKFKQEEYYRLVNERLYELYGWSYYFKQIKIISVKEDIIEALPQVEIDFKKELLNMNIIDYLKKNAEDKYKKDKYDIPNIWGKFDEIGKSSVFQIPDTYVTAQNILTEELIRIGKNNRNTSHIMGFVYDDKDLDDLFLDRY